MSKKRQFGVYAIRNILTGDIYIGSTAESFSIRWNRHRHFFRKGKHQNPHLQRAWDKYGENAFEFSIVEVLDDPGKVIEAEQRHIDRVYGKGCYNILPKAGSPAGIERDYLAKTYPGFIGPDGTLYENVRNLGRFCQEHALQWSGMNYLLDGTYKQHKGWVLIGNEPFVDTVYSFVTPDGTRYSDIRDLADFCRKRGLHLSHMCAVAKGKRRSYKGWTLNGERPGNPPVRIYAFTAPDGTRYEGIENLEAFCREHNLNASYMGQLFRGKARSHKGWTR